MASVAFPPAMRPPVLRRLAQAVRSRQRRVVRLLEDCFPDRVIRARRFKRTFGRRPDLKNPRTFNEKLCWLALYYRPPEVTRCADKYEVRGFVTERVGSGILNELYGVWDHADAIDFDTLPGAFVLKVTWGSGWNIICPEKSSLDVAETRARLSGWMRRSYYWKHREWAYRHIRPRIIGERFLVGEAGGPPSDYKFLCFDGEPRLVQVDTDRFTGHRRDLFDLDWQPVPVVYNGYSPSGKHIPRPSNLDEMLECAGRLSDGFPFVRVDLYSIAGRTIFGEMTWYPVGGEGRFAPESYDEELGQALRLPPRR